MVIALPPRFSSKFRGKFHRMVGPSAVERAVDPVPGGARRILWGSSGVPWEIFKIQWRYVNVSTIFNWPYELWVPPGKLTFCYG